MITIYYVDGTMQSGGVEEWSKLRSEAVDYVDFDDGAGNAMRIQGYSIYWLYYENDAWIVGGGQVGNSEMIEAVAGGFWRRPRYMPDLLHNQTKLGHWLPEGDD